MILGQFQGQLILYLVLLMAELKLLYEIGKGGRRDLIKAKERSSVKWWSLGLEGWMIEEGLIYPTNPYIPS
jgi:hypothetical protein